MEIANHTLPVMEHFYTIQGEGYYQGHAAYFIRLAGCDVGCVWCDVKASWDASQHPQVSIDFLLTQIRSTPAHIVVITGGEPLMYNLNMLTQMLKEAGLRTHIETSGTHPLSGTWDWICFSPKKFKAPLPEILDKAHELKVIVYNNSDLQWATTFAKKINKNCKLFLQPEWSRASEMTPLIISHVKENPEWNISVQLHKFINVP